MTPAQISVAAPLRVRQRLLSGPDGTRDIVHSGAAAIYVDLDGLCLGLVSAGAIRVPCALWSQLPDLTRLGRGPVALTGGTLTVAGVPVQVGRVVDVGVPRRRTRSHEDLERAVPMSAGAEMTAELELPVDGRLTAADVDRLLGRGPGLTPLGDDVLAGWVVARLAHGAPDDAVFSAVRRGLPATTLLSATLLDCALHGEALPELRAWLSDPSASAERALLGVGASSGAGLLTGARLALTSLRTPITDRPGRAA